MSQKVPHTYSFWWALAIALAYTVCVVIAVVSYTKAPSDDIYKPAPSLVDECKRHKCH